MQDKDAMVVDQEQINRGIWRTEERNYAIEGGEREIWVVVLKQQKMENALFIPIVWELG